MRCTVDVRGHRRRTLSGKNALRGALFGVLSLTLGCNRPDLRETRPASSATAPVASVEIHIPERLFGVPTGRVDALGRPERAACVTCHSLRRPASLPVSTNDLDEFHQGLRFEHGNLACSMCHVIGAQDNLHKADGSLIAMRDAMQLCAQCHGPQYRNYQHLSHGGMNGYWDPKSGGRVRNHCIDCHDPHFPRFQPTVPVLPPHDRGADESRILDAHHDTSRTSEKHGEHP